MQVFYSHFWDEHIHSHHKNLATPEDPVCHDIGVNCYVGIVKGIYGTHWASNAREMDRINMKFANKKDFNALDILLENRMVHY
jgi:hypothetical protein